MKDLPMFCEILIFSYFEVIPIYDAEHSLQVYLKITDEDSEAGRTSLNLKKLPIVLLFVKTNCG